MDSLVKEVLDQLEIEARFVENPVWEFRDFAERGVFIGPKHLADEIELMLEEV